MRPCILIAALGFLTLACSRHTPLERAGDVRDPSVPSASPVSESGDSAAGEAADAGGAGEARDAGESPALVGYPELLELRDGEQKLGFVAVPLGARESRPVVIAIHGGSEKPERACAAWRGVTDGYPFVVCPRGFGGRESALGWRTPADTSERIARALGATQKIFGSRMSASASHVLVGFSMGGSQVALVARGDPRRYRRIVVGDSSHDPRPALTFSGTWASGGGERAIFLCTTSGCEPAMRSAARNVASHGKSSRLNVAPTQVHGLSDAAVQSMRRDWRWLIDGAEGWAKYAPAGVAQAPGRTESFEPN